MTSLITSLPLPFWYSMSTTFCAGGPQHRSVVRTKVKSSGRITYGAEEPFETATWMMAYSCRCRQAGEHDGHTGLGKCLIFQPVGLEFDDLGVRVAKQQRQSAQPPSSRFMRPYYDRGGSLGTKNMLDETSRLRTLESGRAGTAWTARNPQPQRRLLEPGHGAAAGTCHPAPGRQLRRGGSFVVRTGQFTGRSPKDKFIVRDETTDTTVQWGAVNQPMTEAHFDRLYSRVLAFWQGHDVYVQDCSVGADPAYALPSG